MEVFGCTASHNTHAEKFCTIPSTGTYEMTVQSQPSAGNIYRIFVQRLNNPAHTLPITGVFFTSEITRNAQFDSYTIEIANAADVFIKIDPNRSKLEPWFIVYGLNGDPLPDCEAESPSIAERECYLPSAGRYTMLVAPRLGRDSIGSYTGSITTKSR